MSPAAVALAISGLTFVAILVVFGRAALAWWLVRRDAAAAYRAEREYGGRWEAAVRAAIDAGATALPRLRAGDRIIQVLNGVPPAHFAALTSVGFMQQFGRVDDKGVPVAHWYWSSDPLPVAKPTPNGFKFEPRPPRPGGGP